jgi:hypothetical protein
LATQNTTNKTFTVTSSATRNDFILGGQIKTYKPWTKGAGQMLTLGAANSQKISDYVNLGSTLNTTLATSNFTVEFWINTLSNDLGDAPIIGNKDWSSGANTGFVISQNKSASILKYNFKTASGSRVDLSFNFPTSVPGWHHVAVVFDRSNSYGLTNASGIVFVDGVQVASQSLGASATTSISASLPWVIGEDGKFAYQTTYGYKVNANIDEVRIWASSRTQAQIRANMCQKLSGSESLLAAYYKFDELSGRTLTNSSIGTSITSYTASAYNGTLVNGVVRSLATTPLGDVSGINFPATADATGWSSQTATTGTMINASSSNRGNLTLKNMNIGSGGTYPNGALVFYSKGYPYTRVSGANNLDTSTNTNNDVYSGLFISGGTNYNYALDYDLSTFSSAYKYINSAGIYGKQNENVTLWNDLGAIPDSVNKTLRLTNVSYGSYDFIPGNSNTSGSALNTGSGKAIQLGIGQTSKVSDYVSLGSNYNSSLATSDFTVEYWVNTLTYDGKTSSHISNQDFSAPTSNTGFSITQKNSTTCTANFKTSGGTSVNLDFTFPNSVAGWHHIAVVADRNTNQTLTVYVDGLQSATTSLSSATPTNSINSSLSWNLGEDGTGTYQAGTSGGKFNGQFDEVKIWSSVRTLTNIRDNMCQKLVGNESYLLGYIKFDNGSGVNATNYSLGTSISSYTASNFAGTLTNAPSWVISGAPVGDASAYNFPASWSGTSISTGAMTNASSSVRGTFNIQNMTSSSTLPDGAFVYYVKGFPNTRVNANNIDTTKNASNDVYTGVFVSGGSGYSYDAVYNLSTYPSSVTSISNGTLFGRQNATITSWTNKSAIPNSSSSTLKLSGLTNTYQEFIPGDGGYNYTTNNKGAGNNLSFGTSTANYNSDYASLGTALNSTLATSDFTLEFWVNTASYDGKDAPYISNKNWHSGANVGLAIAQNSSNTTSKINFTTSGGSRVDLNFTYPNNTPGWHHIAVLADRNSAKTLTIYVDGVQAATTSIATNSPTNSLNSGLPWNIGEDGTGAYQKNESTHPKFNGNIDEVRVWNTLRTVSQIRQYMCQKITGFESNLAAYYKLDNTTGNYFNNNSYGIGLTNYDKSSFNGSLINTNSTTSPLPNWALSGAAIGDTNVVTYASSWSGLSLVNNLLSSSNSGRGTVTVSNISTSLGTVPSGMQLYSVKGYPKTRISSVGTYFDSGANINNDYYFGVFSAGGSNFSYDLVHDYSNYPSAITVNSIAGLAGKTDQTVSAWDDLAATADTINKKLILSAFNTGKLEFIPGNTANGSYPKASFFDKTSFTHKAQFNKTSAFNFGTSTNFTVEFWLKVPTDISTFDTWNAFVGDKDWTSGGNAGWVIFMHKYRSASNTASLEFNLGDGSNRSDSYSGSDVVNRTVNKINDNQWHHVAMTINRTGYGKLYVDGVLRSVRTVSNVGNLNTSYPVLIGVDALGNYANHKFQLDEFKMWNVERSQDSIIAYMEKEISNPLYYSNLLVYYKMDGTNVSLKDAKNNIPLTYTASINRSFNVPITKWATYNGSTWSGATTSPDSTTNALILGSKTLSGKEYYRNIVIGTGGSISGSTSDTVVVTGTNFNVSGGSVSLSNSTIQYKNGNNTPALPWGNFTIGSMEFNNSNGTLPFHNLTVNKTLKLSSGIVDLSGNAPIMANGSTIEFAGGKFNNTVPTVSSVGNTFNLKYCFTTDSNFALTNAFNFINDTTKIGDITINHTGPNRNTITNSYKTVARGKIKIISGTLYQDADLFAKDSIIIRANSRINTQTGSVTDTLWLQNGSYLAESTTGYVKGIVKSKNNLVSFGNDVDMKGVLKLKWNGSTNPGNITIERRHGTSLFGSPKLSHLGRIYNPSNMKWIIKPTYNGNLATQITFPYKTGELNGVGESNLQVFRKPENGIVYNFFKSLTYNYTAKTIQTKPTDSFSEWILGGSNNPLPVELINFSATKVKGYDVALLNWSTAQEDNNDRFEIERLFDNGQWTKVGSIKGIGFSNTVNNYSFNDSFFATTSKSVYYRLKQIDYNGQLEYSPVRKISLTTDFETDIKAWFNKQMGDIQVSINTSSADDKLIITLMDAFGKIVLTENASTIKGLNNIQINAQNIAKGFYLMNISGNSINYSTRLIKY